jgi:hypothetical protein
MKIPGLKHTDLDFIRPLFIGGDAGPERYRYVLWIDIMGSQSKLLRNVRTASIPIMKLHVAALGAVKKNTGQAIALFPMIDGIYVVSEQLPPLMFFMSDVFRSMAAEFLTLKNWERSLVRGAFSFGPVILGSESKKGAEILQESDYANSILVGMPLVQAFVAERQSPPFGVYVHESARAFAPPNSKPFTHTLFRWWLTNEIAKKIAAALPKQLDEYFDWCRAHSMSMSYQLDRIDVHQKLAREYFETLEEPVEAADIAR